MAIDYREKQQRGTPLYPFQIYHMQNAPSTGIGSYEKIDVPYHWHPELEILYIKEGELVVTLGNTEYQAVTGDICFINSGCLHTMYTPIPSTRYDAIVFPLEMLNFAVFDYVQGSCLTPLSGGKLLFPLKISAGTPGHKKLLNILKHIIRCNSHKKKEYQLDTKISLLNVILLSAEMDWFVQPENQTRSSDEKNQTLKDILTYLAAHHTEKLTLQMIAGEFHLSPKYFSRFFKRHFGKTFIEYLNDYRIEHACRLLITTEQTVSTIALSTGFDNIGYFIRVFRSVTGTSPREYRKLKLSQDLSLMPH